MSMTLHSRTVPAHVAHAHELVRRLGEPLLGGNRAEILAGPQAARAALLRLLAEARDHVNLDAAVFDMPELREELTASVQALVHRGIPVQVLAAGVRHAGTCSALRQHGAVVNELSSAWRLSHWVEQCFQSRLRQLVVVDGRVAWCGPGQIGDAAHGPHLCVLGPVVQRLQRMFLHDWKAGGARLAQAHYFPPITLAGRQRMGIAAPAGAGTPATPFGCPLVGAVDTARFSVFIGMAQRVPSRRLLQAVEAAAWRGVNVSVLVPHGIGRSWPWRPCCAELLRAGAWVYEGDEVRPLPPHCIVDGVWSSISLDDGLGWSSGQVGDTTQLIVLDAGFAAALDDACQDAMAHARLLDARTAASFSHWGRWFGLGPASNDARADAPQATPIAASATPGEAGTDTDPR